MRLPRPTTTVLAGSHAERPKQRESRQQQQHGALPTHRGAESDHETQDESPPIREAVSRGPPDCQSERGEEEAARVAHHGLVDRVPDQERSVEEGQRAQRRLREGEAAPQDAEDQQRAEDAVEQARQGHRTDVVRGVAPLPRAEASRHEISGGVERHPHQARAHGEDRAPVAGRGQVGLVVAVEYSEVGELVGEVQVTIHVERAHVAVVLDRIRVEARYRQREQQSQRGDQEQRRHEAELPAVGSCTAHACYAPRPRRSAASRAASRPMLNEPLIVRSCGWSWHESVRKRLSTGVWIDGVVSR